MENESLREPKNTTAIFLMLVVAAVTIWAISASVMASNRRKDVERLTGDKEALRVECEQIKQEALIKMNDAEKLRQTAMEWTRQHQLQVQEDMRKKAEEAAKLAKAKEEAKKTALAGKGKAVPVKKSTVKKTPAKAAPAKKAIHKTPV